jgi:RAB protein geranylgeranyltransferase component A
VEVTSPVKLPYSQFEVFIPYDQRAHATEKDYKNFSRQFNIDLAPKILFSKSVSVDECIKSGVANYLEFQNVTENYVMLDQEFIKIPFSKSEVFSNKQLNFKEKRQLVRVIEVCIKGYDMLEDHKVKVNSTHVYDKDIELNSTDLKLCFDLKDQNVSKFFGSLSVGARMQDILLFAIGQVNELQTDPKVEHITTF